MPAFPTLLVAAVILLGVGQAYAGGIEDEGRRFAEDNCQRCHAVGQAGESTLDAAPPFRTFARNWPVESLAEALAEGIMVGHPEMPTFELTTDQIDALIAHLASLPRN